MNCACGTPEAPGGHGPVKCEYAEWRADMERRAANAADLQACKELVERLAKRDYDGWDDECRAIMQKHGRR